MQVQPPRGTEAKRGENVSAAAQRSQLRSPPPHPVEGGTATHARSSINHTRRRMHAVAGIERGSPELRVKVSQSVDDDNDDRPRFNGEKIETKVLNSCFISDLQT